MRTKPFSDYKMYRILLLFLMAISGETFVNRVRVIRHARDILLRHLVEKPYSELDKDEAYLAMLNAFYHPALAVAQSDRNFSSDDLERLYNNATTADVISNKFVRDVKYIVKRNALALKPLTGIIDEHCVSLANHSCNKLIRTLQTNGKHPDLQRSIAVLDKSYNAGKVFLRMNHNLEKFAGDLWLVIPFEPKMKFIILFFADWIREFGEKKPSDRGGIGLII